jgi:chromosomal replication initiation ATPase DnaA
MTEHRQLALELLYPPDYAAAAFLPAPANAAALAWLDRTPDWPAGRLALWGEAGAGKTHLLHRWAERAGADRLHGPALRGLPPAPARPLAIDDADAMAEEATLFHLLNAAAEAGLPVLLTSRDAPSRWAVRLPDLASRLRAITAVQITPPDDTLLRILLGKLLAEHRLPVPEPVQDWMHKHLPRSAAAMRDAADRLHRAQMEAHKPVTRRMARDCLAPLLASGDEISGSDQDGAAEMTPLL